MIQTIVALSPAQIPSRNDYANNRPSRYALRASYQVRDAVSSLNTAVNSRKPLDCQKRRSTRRVTHTPSGLGIWGLGVVLEGCVTIVTVSMTRSCTL